MPHSFRQKMGISAMVYWGGGRGIATSLRRPCSLFFTVPVHSGKVVNVEKTSTKVNLSVSANLETTGRQCI